MEYYLDQLKRSLSQDLPLLSLLGAFTTIDVISAIDSEDGKTSASKFCSWFREYLPNYEVSPGIKKIYSQKQTEKQGQDPLVKAKDYHNFRCSLLHQLTGSREGDLFASLAFFQKRSQVQAHLSILHGYFFICLELFIEDIIKATQCCMEKSSYYPIHKESIITLHPEGLSSINNLIKLGQSLPVIASKTRGAAKPSNWKK